MLLIVFCSVFFFLGGGYVKFSDSAGPLAQAKIVQEKVQGPRIMSNRDMGVF